MSSIVEGTVGLVVKLMVAKRAWFQLEPSLVRSVSPGFDSRTVQQPTHPSCGFQPRTVGLVVKLMVAKRSREVR